MDVRITTRTRLDFLGHVWTSSDTMVRTLSTVAPTHTMQSGN